MYCRLALVKVRYNKDEIRVNGNPPDLGRGSDIRREQDSRINHAAIYVAREVTHHQKKALVQTGAWGDVDQEQQFRISTCVASTSTIVIRVERVRSMHEAHSGTVQGHHSTVSVRNHDFYM